MRFNNSYLPDEKLLSKISVQSNTSIKDTIKIMNSTALQVAIVVDTKKKYLGIVTDGDIRRGLVKNISISNKVEKIINKHSISLKKNTSRLNAENIMEKNKIEHLPLLDKKNRLKGLFLKEKTIFKERFKNSVIIMAGGKGKRLRPITLKTPKPMIKIKRKPILEHIILRLKKEKFNNFYISVNYLKNKIINYFKNGEKLNVKISYLNETKPLGTIGSLTLFKKKNNLPIIVCNGDILSNVSAESILKFHQKKNSFATIGVIEYYHKNPFGVVISKNFKLLNIQEKPIKKYFINSGIYVFNPNVLKFLEKNKKLDIPDLFKLLKKKKLKTLVFPIHENWKDIGRIEDLKILK